MSLLTDIQAAATDQAHSTADLLRKCQILAYRLGHEQFKEWVAHELNGYPDEEALPVYRGPFHGDIKADTRGPFGQEVRNVQVPDYSIPAEALDVAKTMSFYQGIGTLASLLADAQRDVQTVVATPFPVGVAVLTKVVVDHQTVRMWKELPVAFVAGILDAVRSKALEFTLEIEAENPEAGEARPGDEPPVPIARTDTIFNTTIFGGNVAVGPGATVNVTAGDLGSLLAYLETQGVAAEERAELEAALSADKNKLGPRVKAWLGGVVANTMSFGSGMAQNATGSLIAYAVLKFLGLA